MIPERPFQGDWQEFGRQAWLRTRSGPGWGNRQLGQKDVANARRQPPGRNSWPWDCPTSWAPCQSPRAIYRHKNSRASLDQHFSWRFSSYPVTGSFSRSAASSILTAWPSAACLSCKAVNNATGAQSQFAGLITALVMLCGPKHCYRREIFNVAKPASLAPRASARPSQAIYFSRENQAQNPYIG